MSDSSVKFTGNRKVVWGTNGLYREGVIVSSASDQRTSDKEEIKDNDGNVVVVVFFNMQNQTSVSAICNEDDANNLPEMGDIVEICGKECVVNDVKLDWTQGSSAKFSISATKYDQLQAE